MSYLIHWFYLKKHKNMKALSFGSFAILSSMVLLSCANRPDQTDIVVLYTTDMHGAYLHYDIRTNMPAVTSMANVCTYVKQQREEYPDARIIGHCELPHVVKSCPCFIPSTYYASLQPKSAL